MAARPPLDVRKVKLDGCHLSSIVRSQELARKTALNLFRFIESFSETGSQALLTSPSVVLDKWFQRYVRFLVMHIQMEHLYDYGNRSIFFRFEEKYRRDPDFILKTE